MGLFKEQNYKTIVAPLEKMARDLIAYIEEQKIKITNLEDKKTTIEGQISVSTHEISKSNFTTKKISEMIASDDKWIASDEILEESKPDPAEPQD